MGSVVPESESVVLESLVSESLEFVVPESVVLESVVSESAESEFVVSESPEVVPESESESPEVVPESPESAELVPGSMHFQAQMQSFAQLNFVLAELQTSLVYSLAL